MLLQEARWLTAAANLLIHNSVGLVFLFLGLVAARVF
jgi:fluoride ion exporter CrcB/FEX